MAATDSAHAYVEHAPGDVLIAEIVNRGLSLADIERGVCLAALQREGTIHGAANRLCITRHALKRRIIKHEIDGLSSKGWR